MCIVSLRVARRASVHRFAVPAGPKAADATDPRPIKFVMGREFSARETSSDHPMVLGGR